MQSALSFPDPVASPSSIGRFGAGLRGLCGSPTSTANLHQDGGSSLHSSPQRSAVIEPVLLGSPEAEVGINYFTYGATKETMIRIPELHRHVLSTSFDAEAVRQVAQASTTSKNLQGPVDLAAAGTPMASGSTAPNRSPYLQTLPNLNRGPRPGDLPMPVLSLPAPMRPLSSLLEAGVVGSPAAGVRRARRQGAAGESSRGGSSTSIAANPGFEQLQVTIASKGRGSTSSISAGLERSSPVPRGASRISVLSYIYGQPSAPFNGGPSPVAMKGENSGAEASSSDEENGGSGGDDRTPGVRYGGNGLRYYYLSQYVPPLHLPPALSPVTPVEASGTADPPPEGCSADDGSATVPNEVTGAPNDGSTGPYGGLTASGDSLAASASVEAGPTGSIQLDDEALKGHIEHLLNLHLHDSSRQQQQSTPSPSQPPPPHHHQHMQHGPQSIPVGGQQQQQQLLQQQMSDPKGGLPALDLRAIHAQRAFSASSTRSTASLSHNPIGAARLNAQLCQQSLTDRSGEWRRSMAADAAGGGGGLRRPVSSQQRKPVGAQLSGTLADWVRSNHSIHSVIRDLHVRVQASGLWSEGPQGPQRRRQHRNGGGNASGATGAELEANGAGSGGGGGGGGRVSNREEDLAAVWGRPRRRRGPIRVDPELVRQYTERPPKLCTPNNASRPVTSSDFVAFKNHTVNRAGTANTLRTVLGSNSPASGGGAGPGAGAAAAAEARGVTPLTTLLGPCWVAPALRPRSPHIGIGGILTGSSNSVPGLHVPLELDPPPLPPPASSTASPQVHSNMFHRSLELSDGIPWLGSPGAGAAAPAAGDRTGTPLTVSTFGAASSLPAPVQAVTAPRAGPAPHVRCGAGELILDVQTWLTPATAPSGELCGLFNGDDGESVALLSRVVKGAVQCDLGWAEVSESLMFMSTVTVPNAVLRFAVPHRAILQRFAATIGGTTLIGEAMARSSGGSGFELEEDDEDDDPGPGKAFTKGFGRRNHQPGPGGRPPMLRVPLGKVRGDIFITISYIVQLECAGNTLSLTHVCNWTPARMGWHLMSREQLMSVEGTWSNNTPNIRRSKHKASDLYDLSFELEILSHRGLNLVSGPRHMTIKPNYDALLIQGYTQVWRPRHVTTVTFELALAVPLRSFAILHDARRAGPDADPEPLASSVRRATNGSYTDGASGSAGGDGGGGAAAMPSPPQASSSLRLIVPTDMAHLAPGADSTKSTITLRSAPPASGLNLEPRPLSTRHCAAVTFVPSSHFSPAELEDVLGPEVAPGPRAQAAAIRAGLPGGPGPLPVELWIVMDCCGPTGIAAHLMQMLQNLQVLLRSLPVGEGGGGGGTVTSSGGGGGISNAVTTGGSIGVGGMIGSGSSVGGSTTGGGGSVGAAVASATLFNVVICPAGPLVLDPEDEEAALAKLPPELASLHLATRQQQHQQLLMRKRQQQQLQQAHGLIPADTVIGVSVGVDDVPPAPMLLPDAQQQQQQTQRESPLSQQLLQQQQQHLMLMQQEDIMALPPLWLFPGGSRPVSAENVAAALGWVEQMLADVPTLAAWAQPVSALHDLLADVAWSPRPSGCRRAAVVLCQQVMPTSGEPGNNANADAGAHGSAAVSPSSTGGGSRSPTLRRTGGGSASRLTTKHLNVVNQLGKASSSGGGGSRAASARLRLKLDSESGSRANSRPNSRPASRANSRPPSRCLSRSVSRSPSRSLSPTTPASRPGSPKGPSSPSGLRRGLSFGDQLPPVGYTKAAAAAVGAADTTGSSSQILSDRQDSGGRAGGAGGSESVRSTNADLGGGSGGDGEDGMSIVQPNATLQSSAVGRPAAASPEPYRPRSSMARGGQGRSGGGGADGVRWSNGIVSNPRVRRGGGSGSIAATAAVGSSGEGGELSDSDPEAAGRPRATGPSPLRSGSGSVAAAVAADGNLTGTSGDEEEELSTGPPAADPPDVGFPVFVIMHALPQPPSNALLAAGLGLGAAANFGTNGPSYLLAHHLYQKHIEAVLYRQARDEVEQLPLSYFERLSELHGGFVQVVSSPLELSSALVLAASCAVNGRYLRQLRVVARGSVIREQFPAKLPSALPLSEPLTLLVRMSRMQAGAALELQGVWPNGRPAHMEVSVDPRLRTTGQLLPVLCALSEVSELLKDVPFAVPRVSAASANATNNSSGVPGSARSGSQTLSGGASSPAPAAASAATTNSATAVPGWPPVRVTPQQQAAKRKVTHKALAFNLVTPFTAMALVSMTLISNRGLTVQTLQTTQGRTADQRHAFVWPAPVMAALTAAAKDAALHNNGAVSPYHTAATFAAAAAAVAGPGQGGQPGQPGQVPPGQSAAMTGQLELPAELIAIMSGSMSMSSDPLSNGGSGVIGATPPDAATAIPPVAPAAAAAAAASAAATAMSAVDGDLILPLEPMNLPPVPTAHEAALDAIAATVPVATDVSNSEPHCQGIGRFDTEGGGGGAESGGASRARRRSTVIQELTVAIAISAQVARGVSDDGQVSPVTASSPHAANPISPSYAAAAAAASHRQSAVDPQDLPVASHSSTAIMTGSVTQIRAMVPMPPAVGSAAAAVFAMASNSFIQTITGTGGLSASQSQLSSSAPFPSPKLVLGPYAPPLSPAVSAEAHQLTVLGRLAAMQCADGSWPAVPELEELVVSNGRTLVVPILGTPKPMTQAEKTAAEVREGRRREALSNLRGQTLRGAVSGTCWSTVMALALLSGKYGPQRLAWIPLETSAFAWLDRKWPPMSACGMSAPTTIMRISSLL